VWSEQLLADRGTRNPSAHTLKASGGISTSTISQVQKSAPRCDDPALHLLKLLRGDHGASHAEDRRLPAAVEVKCAIDATARASSRPG
jgi:hypothetical protein